MTSDFLWRTFILGGRKRENWEMRPKVVDKTWKQFRWWMKYCHEGMRVAQEIESCEEISHLLFETEWRKEEFYLNEKFWINYSRQSRYTCSGTRRGMNCLRVVKVFLFSVFFVIKTWHTLYAYICECVWVQKFTKNMKQFADLCLTESHYHDECLHCR